MIRKVQQYAIRMPVFTSKFFKLALYGDLHATQATLFFAELLWAITLFSPGPTFHRNSYDIMKYLIASEFVWGFMFLTCAFARLTMLSTGKYHTCWSLLFASYSCILWWYVTISMYISSDVPPAAVSGEFALAIAASWIFIRSGWVPVGVRRSYDDIPIH